ncbi:AAA family ATPase [Streptomyces sp. NPDC087300]|uniref:AAA family ATPase n=1 Tax=Streptomyces sp. NPDC087300 TaxID=3365780 RepID=UPI0037FC973C
MIIWLNGTFGAGKTTTAHELTALLPESRIFDAEQVGYMLRHVPGLAQGDFQDLKPWRGLVVATASQLLDHLGGTLVVPQTVLLHPYWQEIHEGLLAAGIPVHHFVLHADRATLARRIATDMKPDSIPARRWRRDHLTLYEEALPWLREAARVIDTTELPPALVAQRIATAVESTGRPASG